MKIYLSLTSVLCVAILVLAPVIVFSADDTDHGSSDHADGGQDALSAHPGSRVIFHRQLKYFYNTNVSV